MLYGALVILAAGTVWDRIVNSDELENDKIMSPSEPKNVAGGNADCFRDYFSLGPCEGSGGTGYCIRSGYYTINECV